MKTPESLHTKILEAARDEVCRNEEWGKGGYEESMIDAACNHPEKLQARMYVIESKAALLAMEKQAEFFRHIFFVGWRIVDNIDEGPIYEQGKQSPQQTELELYKIFTTPQ